MLKQLAWAVGFAGRKSADYLVGVPGKSRGKLNELGGYYKLGTHGYRKAKGDEASAPKAVADLARDAGYVL